MKHFFLLAVCFLCSAALSSIAAETPAKDQAVAETEAKKQPLFDWSLLWTGSWEESRTLHNRGEVRLNFLPPGLALRGEVLDRHTMNFELDPPWGNPANGITNFAGGLYHKSTGSRLLYGVLDEWGLSARIRNPWIRSAPYAENHKPLMADLKTAASATKEDEAYLYLSSPFINLQTEGLFSNLKFRGFVSAQTPIENPAPAVSGGLEAVINKNTGFLIETFYTGSTLPPTKSNSWFSYPPPLPEREFRLFAAGFLFSNPLVSVSSDWAFSETFAWGIDIYGNLGVCVTPPLTIGGKFRPLSVSFAADGAGERFIYRDGASHGEGFRTAGKIELKGARNSLMRLNTVLRGPAIGEDFTRSSAGFYYRFPARTANSTGFPVRMTRVSLTASRNADNPEKINDSLSGYLGLEFRGFPLNSSKSIKINPIGVVFSGSVKGLTSQDADDWVSESAAAACEINWPSAAAGSLIFQFKSKFGYTAYEKKDDKWDVSFSATARFRHGGHASRLTLKAATADFPDNWSFTVSFRLEQKNK